MIGQGRVKDLIRCLPVEVKKKVNGKKSETVFRFGNNAVLPSLGAVYTPFGGRWLRIEVVEGQTPFLLSNSFLKALNADVCRSNSSLRLNSLSKHVPLKTNSKGLFVVELTEVLAAFDREHDWNIPQVVSNVSTETHQELKHAAAPVAQRLEVPSKQATLFSASDSVSHAAGICRSSRHAAAIPGGSDSDLHDNRGRCAGLQASRNPESPASTRGKTQEQHLHGDCGERLQVRSVDHTAQEPHQRLGLEQNEHGHSARGDNSSPDGEGQRKHEKEPGSRTERGRGGADCDSRWPQVGREADNSGKKELACREDHMATEVNAELVSQLQCQIAVLQRELDKVTNKSAMSSTPQ